MANYEAAFRDLDNPASEDYKPWPNGNMTLDVLKSNRNFIWARRTMWNERWPSGNKKEKANMTKIIAALDEKTAAYDKAITGFIPIVVTTVPPAGVIVNDPILQTAQPSVTTAPSQTPTGGSTVTTSNNTITPAATPGNTTFQQPGIVKENPVTVDPVLQTALPGVNTAPSQTKTNSIPKWAIYTGIGLAGLIVVALIVKK